MTDQPGELEQQDRSQHPLLPPVVHAAMMDQVSKPHMVTEAGDTSTWQECAQHPGHENHCASGACGRCWLCTQNGVQGAHRWETEPPRTRLARNPDTGELVSIWEDDLDTLPTMDGAHIYPGPHATQDGGVCWLRNQHCHLGTAWAGVLSMPERVPGPQMPEPSGEPEPTATPLPWVHQWATGSPEWGRERFDYQYPRRDMVWESGATVELGVSWVQHMLDQQGDAQLPGGATTEGGNEQGGLEQGATPGGYYYRGALPQRATAGGYIAQTDALWRQGAGVPTPPTTTPCPWTDALCPTDVQWYALAEQWVERAPMPYYWDQLPTNAQDSLVRWMQQLHQAKHSEAGVPIPIEHDHDDGDHADGDDDHE